MNGNIKVFGFCNRLDAPTVPTGDYRWFLLKSDRDAALLAKRRLAVTNGLAIPAIQKEIFAEDRKFSKIGTEAQEQLSKQGFSN